MVGVPDGKYNYEFDKQSSDSPASVVISVTVICRLEYEIMCLTLQLYVDRVTSTRSDQMNQ